MHVMCCADGWPEAESLFGIGFGLGLGVDIDAQS
jgi:hypothetical protein